MRNDVTICDRAAHHWWSDDARGVRTLKHLVPGRLAWFDRRIDWHIDWQGKDVLRRLPRGTHDPRMVVTPRQLRGTMQGTGLVPGAARDDPRPAGHGAPVRGHAALSLRFRGLSVMVALAHIGIAGYGLAEFAGGAAA